MQACASCGQPVEPLAAFPPPDGKDGVSCLDCYATSPAGRYMPTAAEIRRAFGGR